MSSDFIIWASVESVYWILDLIMSKYKHVFYLCRNAYAGALIVPVMYVSRTLTTVILFVINAIVFIFMVSSESCDLFVSRSSDRTLCRYIQI